MISCVSKTRYISGLLSWPSHAVVFPAGVCGLLLCGSGDRGDNCCSSTCCFTSPCSRKAFSTHEAIFYFSLSFLENLKGYWWSSLLRDPRAFWHPNVFMWKKCSYRFSPNIASSQWSPLLQGPSSMEPPSFGEMESWLHTKKLHFFLQSIKKTLILTSISFMA